MFKKCFNKLSEASNTNTKGSGEYLTLTFSIKVPFLYAVILCQYFLTQLDFLVKSRHFAETQDCYCFNLLQDEDDLMTLHLYVQSNSSTVLIVFLEPQSDYDQKMLRSIVRA